jgi:hypothetical protein
MVPRGLAWPGDSSIVDAVDVGCAAGLASVASTPPSSSAGWPTCVAKSCVDGCSSVLSLVEKITDLLPGDDPGLLRMVASPAAVEPVVASAGPDEALSSPRGVKNSWVLN